MTKILELFKPHIVVDGNGVYRIRKLTLFGYHYMSDLGGWGKKYMILWIYESRHEDFAREHMKKHLALHALEAERKKKSRVEKVVENANTTRNR